MLLKLVLNNFRSHRQTTIDFTPGFNMIVGENGSGKSSIAIAIGIALFDVDRSNLKRYVTVGQDTASIDVYMLLAGGMEYHVSRSFGKVSSWRVYDQDGVVADGHDACVATLQLLFKLNDVVPLDQFYSELIGVKQFQMTTPFEKAQSRKQFFDGLLGVTEYQTTFENLLAGVRFGKEKLAGFEKDLAVAQYAKIEQEKQRENIQAMLENRASLIANITAIESEIGIMTHQVAEMAAEFATWQRYKQKAVELDNARTYLAQTEKRIQQALMRRGSVLGEIERLNGLADELSELEVRFAQYILIKNEYDLALSAHHTKAGEFETKRLNLSTAIAHLQEYNTCFVCGTRLDESARKRMLNARVNELNELTLERFTLEPPVDPTSRMEFIKAKVTNLESLQKQFNSIEAELDGLGDEAKALRCKIAELSGYENVSFDTATYEAAQERLKNYERESSKARGKLESIEASIVDATQAASKDLDSAIIHLQANISFAKETMETLEKVRQLYKLLGPLMAQRFASKISTTANGVLNRILGEHYPVSMELGNDYEIEVTVGKNKLTYPMLSGGQQVMVALAMRLAVTLELSNVSFMVVDEPFDSLDPLSHEGVVGAINSFRGVQLVVIAHQDVFADLDNVVRLELSEEGYSCVI